jgi:enoyl-CoA hydratase/carnithine racemase
MTNNSNDDIIIEIRNHVAYLTFNRPQALNALSLNMLKTMRDLFDRWTNDANIYAVVSQGSGEKAYCAGGDVRGLYNSVTGSGANNHEDFFQTEYTLNYQMHRFLKNCGKPYIAMIDGIVMGGGMGVSQGATLRIVGERTKMAMPETKIGLFPDVGGTYFLSRATGALGLYLGLTSNIINGADAIHAKLADIYMRRDAQQQFHASLDSLDWSDNHLGDVVRLAKSHASTPPAAPIAAFEKTIDRHFTNKNNVSEIIAALQAEAEPSQQAWSTKIAADLLLRSPTLLEVTKHQIENGGAMTLVDCLRLEYNMMMQVFAHPDVVEGIRALAIDKDNQPKWQPAHLHDVTAEMVEAFFKPRWPHDKHPLAHLDKLFG